jgi:hypothetical protein
MSRLELDLHDIRHANVSIEIDKFLNYHIVKGSYEVIIVTGNSENMKKIVRECLNDYNLEAEDSIINTGILIIKL